MYHHNVSKYLAQNRYYAMLRHHPIDTSDHKEHLGNLLPPVIKLKTLAVKMEKNDLVDFQ